VHSDQVWKLFANPFLSWVRLACRAGEMSIAAAQVVGRRTGRLALIGPALGPGDRRELVMMGQEKGEAAMESAQAVGMGMLMLNQQFAALAFRHMVSTSSALISLAASRTPAESAQRQAKLVRDTTANSTVMVSKVSRAAAKLAGEALAPVHSRVNRNVRRLSKKSK
jgi:hypothetical protein